MSAPMAKALSAQALVVRLDGDYVHIAAPQLHFLSGKILDRLRDGAQVLIPNLGQQRIQAPSAGRAPAGAARGQAQAAVMKACSADIPKLCAGQNGGGAMRCLRQNLSSVSAGCAAQLQRAGRGGRGNGGSGGGGFGGAP